MTCTIRPATPQDHAALAEQFLGLNLYEEDISHNRRTDVAGGEESLVAAWDKVRETGGHALVAELEGHVVGHMFMIFHNEPVFVREELRPVAYVTDLFVREAARGRGIATALMAQAERLAAEGGVRRLMLGVLAGNHAAEALYARLGFTAHAYELEKPVGGA
jgi:GNAT superfamily N-acetyltransferase